MNYHLKQVDFPTFYKKNNTSRQDTDLLGLPKAALLLRCPEGHSAAWMRGPVAETKNCNFIWFKVI